jgi:hypothetical protein
VCSSWAVLEQKVPAVQHSTVSTRAPLAHTRPAHARLQRRRPSRRMRVCGLMRGGAGCMDDSFAFGAGARGEIRQRPHAQRHALRRVGPRARAARQLLRAPVGATYTCRSSVHVSRSSKQQAAVRCLGGGAPGLHVSARLRAWVHAHLWACDVVKARARVRAQTSVRACESARACESVRAAVQEQLEPCSGLRLVGVPGAARAPTESRCRCGMGGTRSWCRGGRAGVSPVPGGLRAHRLQ